MSMSRLEDVVVETRSGVIRELILDGYTMCKYNGHGVYTFRVTDYNQFYSKFINLDNRLSV